MVAAQTGIAPLALRDCAAVDPRLFDEVVDAANAWTVELELAASQLEVVWAQLRATATLPGGRQLPALAIPRARSLAREPRRVSVGQLAELTGRELVPPQKSSSSRREEA